MTQDITRRSFLAVAATAPVCTGEPEGGIEATCLSYSCHDVTVKVTGLPLAVIDMTFETDDP
jgi:hypothetical protein